MTEHQIQLQKREALACFLSSDPTTAPIPVTEATIASPSGKGAATLNKAFLAAVVASVARPNTAYAIGEGWAGEHHGGPRLGLYAGDVVSGQALGLVAMDSEVLDGLQGGGREFHGGYAVGVYYVGYMLALRHGSRDMRKLAARALAANLAIDYLLTVPGTKEVVEIGGRATGGANQYAAVIQRLWAGEPNVKAPQSDAGISCQMFAELRPQELSMLPLFPPGVEGAVAILEASGVVCPAGFEWWGWDDGGWRAQVNRERYWFIKKRTGKEALIVEAGKEGFNASPDFGRSHAPPADYDWHLTLTEHGLHILRRPGGEAPSPTPDKPTPPPRPEEPTDPPDPETHHLDEGDRLARQLAQWGDDHKFQPARKLGREVRRAIHAERKRLKEEEAHEE